MSRFRPDKNKSQIVFDITGGEKFASMTMATIPKKQQIIRSNNEDYSLKTDDIIGAKPRIDTRPTHDFINVHDIDGAKPASPFDHNKPPTDVMAVRDIDGAQPRICRNLPHSQRHTNPLNPVYQLPTKEELPPPEIKFVYDGINYDDIPGVHPKSYKQVRPPKDIMKIDDIPGTQHISKTRRFDSSNRILDVSDINNDGVFHTKRETNPLTPEYYINGENLVADYGKSQTNYKSRKGITDYSLKTKDIEGAQHDSSTTWYRTFKNNPIPDEDGTEESTSLMLPSMSKQTAELERQKAINKMRGDKIRRFESRHLNSDNDHVDHVQAELRQRRAKSNMYKKGRNTFQNDPIIL